MKTSSLNKEFLLRLEPDDAAAYLSSKHWKEVWTDGNRGSVWKKEIEGSLEELLIPLDRELRDYSLRLREALTTLAELESRDELDVARDIALATVDVVRVRAPKADEKLWSIKFRAGAELIEKALEMVGAAASAAVAPKPLFDARRTKLADEYMKDVELGQTERGSYVVTVLSPVRPILDPAAKELLDEWFPRKVTRTLARSLRALRDATTNAAMTDDVEPFEQKVEDGVSANLCEAVAGMLEVTTDSGRIDVEIAWAARMPEKRAAYEFTTEEAVILRKAAKALRETAPMEGLGTTGVVTDLHRVEGQPGEVTVFCAIGETMRKLKLPLSDRDYEIAIEAHRQRRPVLFIVDINRVGRQFIGSNVRDFKIYQGGE